MRNEMGFRKCLESNGIKLRWNFENRVSYLESCNYYINYYEKIYGADLPKNKNADILEIGCSYGWFLYYLKKKEFSNHFGIDLDETKINLLKKFGIANVENKDAFEYLENHRNCFDLIVVTFVLEHISKEKIFLFLKLIHDALRENGKIIVTVPNMESPFNLRLRYLDFTHEMGFTVNSLLHVMYYSNYDDLTVRDMELITLDECKTERYLKRVECINEIFLDLKCSPPLFFGMGLICVGIKGKEDQ